jgi:hypothetical protein
MSFQTRYRAKVELSPEDKAAARQWRDSRQEALQALIEAERPTYTPPALLAILRHPCPARGDISTALQLHEVYETDPTGKWCFIYKKGTCRGCKATAISPTGRFELTSRRPPVDGRMKRD